MNGAAGIEQKGTSETMFTGITTAIGQVEKVERREDLRAVISSSYDTDTIVLGTSIACSGVCLTVVETGENWFAVDISEETVSRTASGHWEEGASLNLERSLKVGDELGGHIVTGHVDGVGRVDSIAPAGGSIRIDIALPDKLRAYVAAKGSIAVDGVSLTVNSVEDGGDASRFSLNIIPHTAEVTTLGGLKAGDEVNLEIDILARYLARMEEVRALA